LITTQRDSLLFERLRLETHDLHQLMERELPIFTANFDLAAYRVLLERYAGFYAPVEARLTALRAMGLDVFDETRRKLPLIELDLNCLHSSGPVPQCGTIPKLETVSQGIGCMYVLEGSTLGGQIISRHLKQSLNITPENGGAFFVSYGAALGKRWKEFREIVLADERSHSETDEIIAAARDTFQSFHNWLT
jgi:heme oxygenase